MIAWARRVGSWVRSRAGSWAGSRAARLRAAGGLVALSMGSCAGTPPAVTPSPSEVNGRAALAGDAEPSPPGSSTPQASSPQPGTPRLVVGELIEDGTAPSPLTAAELAPLTPADERWVVLAGHDAGAEFRRTRGPADTNPAPTLVIDRWGDDQVCFLTAAADGAVTMARVTSPGDRATSHFDPPLLIAPARLAQGAPAKGVSRMRVVDSADEVTPREHGRTARTVTFVGRVPVETPLGAFVAWKVTTEFRAALQLASVTETATQYIVPGLGIVAEERRQRVTAVGIVNRSSERTIVRVE